MTDWSGKRVLVTGAAGFIGSHLVESLVRQGGQIRAFVRYDSRGSRGALESIDPAALRELDVVQGDLRDAESTTAAIAGFDTVFHLGALIAIPYSYVNPRSFFETNVLGALNVAHACVGAGVERLVHTSTSEVYGSAQAVPMTEDHPLVAQSPYSASKIGADKLVESFRRSFDLPATTVRPFNTYGPRQSARAIVPTIIAQALQGDVVTLGSTTPRRDLTFVSDTVSGFLAIAESPATIGETLHIGSGHDVSVGDLVEEVAQVLGKDLQVQEATERVRPATSEVERLVADTERLRTLTAWSPAVPLRDGLSATAEWIRAHPYLFRPSEYAI